MARAFVIGIIVALAIATGIIALDRFGVIHLRQRPAVSDAEPVAEEAVAEEFEEVTADDGTKVKRKRAPRSARVEKKAAEAKPAKEPPPKKREPRLALPGAGAINAVRLPPELPDHKVASVIAGQSQELSRCLGEALKRGDDVGGRILVQMTIDIYGRGSESHIKGGKHERSTFGRCLLNRLKGMRFPQFTGEPVTIVFPIDVTTE